MFKYSRDVIRLFTFTFAMLILQSSLSIAQVTVSLPNVPKQAVGASVVLPIAVGNLTGQNVRSYQFTLSYDTATVKITGYEATGTMSSAMTIVSNFNVPGKVTVAAAGVNALTGSGILLNLDAEIVGLASGTLAWSSFMFNEGTPTAITRNGAVNVVPDLNVTVPAVSDTVGALVLIPINTDSLTGQGVYAYQFSASYDTTVLQLTGQGYSTVGSISAAQGLTIQANMRPGTITIAAASSSPLSGKGALIYLTGKILKAGTTALTIAGFEYNEGTPTVGVTSGSVTGTLVNHPPVITGQSKVPDTLQVGSSYTFAVTATDPDPNDTLTYTWSVNDTVKQVGRSPFFTTTLPVLKGNVIVKVVVTDMGGLSVSATWTFLVTAVQKQPSLPTQFGLDQNYPNPFNPTTVISFDVPKPSAVRIVVYDILGKEVRTLVNNTMSPGTYHVTWDGLNDEGRQVSSGIYFYRMEAGSFVSMKKMLLLK